MFFCKVIGYMNVIIQLQNHVGIFFIRDEKTKTRLSMTPFRNDTFVSPVGGTESALRLFPPLSRTKIFMRDIFQVLVVFHT